MIAVDRGRVSAPAKLVSEGPLALQQNIASAATSTPPTLVSGHFDRAIYGTAEVKRALWEMQHGKCCFCERELEVKFATVEHFRPKTRATDGAGNARLGYWWLGYEFENLYFCCQNCNNPKGDFFPLAPGAKPLGASTLPSKANPPEAALIVDPGAEDPEQHIDWVFVDGKGAKPVGKDEKGKTTIEATKLDVRDELTMLRGRYYRKFVVPVIRRHKRAVTNHDAAAEADAVADAQLLAEADSPYVGMARAMLRKAGVL